MVFDSETKLLTGRPDLSEELIVGSEATYEDLYKVIIHNDAVTTTEFVIYVLIRIFHKPHILAEAIMWEAHNHGHAVVDVLAESEAKLRVNKAHTAARMEGFPLELTMEPA